MGFDADEIMRILSLDPSQLANNELLEIIIRPFVKDYQTVVFNLFSDFGTFEDVCTADPDLLKTYEGMTSQAVCAIKAVHAAAFNLLEASAPQRSLIAFTKENSYNFFKPHFLGKKEEELYLMLIDSSDRILCLKQIAKGNMDELVVDPKYVIELACKYKASKAVLAHNHVTGPAPSLHDVLLTSRLVFLFAHMKVELCDHYIFYQNKWHSMVDAGEMIPLSYNLILSKDL